MESKKGKLRIFFENRRYVKNEKAFAKSKNDELHELIVSTDNLNVLEDIKMTPFVTTKEEILDFAKKFINVAFKNEELKNRLIQNLEGFDLIVLKNGENWNKANGSVYHENGTIKKYAVIGRESADGKIISNFQDIKILMHETIHLASLKHQNDNGSEVAPEKGELEASILERIYSFVLKEKANEIKTERGYPFGLDETQIKKEAEKIEEQQLIDFRERAKSIKDEKQINKHQSKSYDFRYVMGYVGADYFIDSYKQNQESAENSLLTYLDSEAKLTVDEAMQVISGATVSFYGDAKPEVFGGDVKTYSKMMELFKNKHHGMKKAQINRVSKKEIKEERTIDGNINVIPDYLVDIKKAEQENSKNTDINDSKKDFQIEK